MLAISVLVWFTIAEDQTEKCSCSTSRSGCPRIVLVFFRRRWPVPVAVHHRRAERVSSLAAGPATLAAVSLATRRRWLQIVAIGVLSVAGGPDLHRGAAAHQRAIPSG